MRPAERYAERLGRLQRMMAEQHLDGLLCFGNNFRRDYLRYVHPAPTPSPYGFCLLAPDGGGTLFVEAPWDTLPAAETVQQVIGARTAAGVARAVAARVRQLGLGPRLGLAGGDVMESAFHEAFREHLGATELVPASQAVMDLRYVKDAAELDAVRRAAAIADAGWQTFVATCQPGVPQYEIIVMFDPALGDEAVDGVGQAPVVGVVGVAGDEAGGLLGDGSEAADEGGGRLNADEDQPRPVPFGDAVEGTAVDLSQVRRVQDGGDAAVEEPVQQLVAGGE